MYNYINIFLIITQISLVSFLIFFSLKLGKEAISSFLALLAVCMNLFVIKQITLFGLQVTASEGLAVGYLLGFNLFQEFFGKKEAQKSIWISFLCTVSFTLLSQLHLSFTPNSFDFSQIHFKALLSSMPRIVIASLLSFLLVQFFDLTFFSFLRKKMKGNFLTYRIFLSLTLSQAIDTVLFSLLGLYGIVEEVTHVMLFSFSIKLIVILLSTPFITIAKRIIRREPISI